MILNIKSHSCIKIPHNAHHTIDYDANNYIGSGSAPDHHNYNRNHHHYPEPPEPIIEIIIQDNNETLPEPQPIQSHGKKKKEQVQVFYVKYHKDEKKGLVIHEPVAALSPAGHEQVNLRSIVLTI